MRFAYHHKIRRADTGGFNRRDSFLILNIFGIVKRVKTLTLIIVDGYTGVNLLSKCLPYIKGTRGLHVTKG
jgi:hypothetical protein